MHWWTSAPAEARRALIAAGLGWMLDAFDVMIYALVLAALITDLGLDKAVAGQLGSLTLLASAAGGMLFGLVADRYGRTRALMASILLYSIFTAACGLAQNVAQLAVFRVFLGLGMGGEWASGAALVSETWPDEHRGKALGLMQSAWAIGYAAAAIVTAIVLPLWGWRAVFFVGILPAFFTLWVRRKVEEPRVWRERRKQSMTGLSPEAEDLGPTKMTGRTVSRSPEAEDLWLPEASAFAPFIVGTLAQARGFDVALTTAAVAFVGAAIVWVWITVSATSQSSTQSSLRTWSTDFCAHV